MGHLSEQDNFAIAIIVLYVPIIFTSILLIIRHGFRKQGQWMMLLLLAIVRITASVLQLVASNNPTNLTLQVIPAVLQQVGLSPLLITAIGLLELVSQYTSFGEMYILKAGRVVLRLVCMTAIALSAYGASKLSGAQNSSDIDSASSMRHIGAILLLLVYLAIAAFTVFCWSQRSSILEVYRKLLLAALLALPFVCIRIVYSVLGSFAPPTIGFDSSGNEVEVHPNSSLEKFVPITGSFGIYIVMSFMMEYIAVLLYTVYGMLTTPLKNLQPPSGYDTESQGGRSPLFGGISADNISMFMKGRHRHGRRSRR